MRLDGVLGQRPALQRLSAELSAGRLAHAYLFVGPAGVGRGSTARALFLALNCRQRDRETPCGQCDSCHRFLAGTHEDFIELAPPDDAASAQIKVEAVRQVIHTLGFAPFAGGVRLVLIRSAGHLNPSSANALLKTLEEPPPDNILVLTVQDPRELLPTLVSRCRKVTFSPLPDETVQGELVRRGVDPEAARLRAAAAGGSLGRALELDEDELGRRLEWINAALGRGGGPAEDWAFAEELVGAFRGARIDRQGLAQALDLMALIFRDQAVSAAGRPEMRLMAGQSPDEDLELAAERFALVRRAQERILGNAAPELAVAVLMDDLRRAGTRRRF